MSACRFRALVAAAHITIKDPARAAQQLNWLVMAHPLNEAMFVTETLPTREINAHVRTAVDLVGERVLWCSVVVYDNGLLPTEAGWRIAVGRAGLARRLSRAVRPG